MEHRGRPSGITIERYVKLVTESFNKAVKDTAEEISFRIESIYESAIEDFYLSYEPKSYSRTYSTFLGSNHYETPFEYMQFGNTYFSGIQVDSGNIPGDPYRAKKNWVFDRSFYKGIHGFITVDQPKINKRKKEIGYRIKIKNYPERMRGSRLAFDPNDSTGKRSMSPKNLMDTRFRKYIAKPGAIDAVFRSFFYGNDN